MRRAGLGRWPESSISTEIGYLQLDLYPSRLFLPTLPGVAEAEMSPYDGQLAVKIRDKVVATVSYWNAGWGPARPRQLGGNCGTALLSRGKAYRGWPEL